MTIKIVDDEMDHLPRKEISSLIGLNKEQIEHMIKKISALLEDCYQKTCDAVNTSEYAQVLPSQKLLLKLQKDVEELLKLWSFLKSYKLALEYREGPKKSIDPGKRKVCHDSIEMARALEQRHLTI